MSRPKHKDEAERLTHTIIVRVNEATFKRLESMSKNSSYRTIAEVARRILTNERIKLFYRDTSMNGPMEELALIRKELRSIGININQQTHYFHMAQRKEERIYYLDGTGRLYKQVDEKVNRLLGIVAKLLEKWCKNRGISKN